MRRVFLAACVLVGVGALISAAPAPPPPMPLPQKLAQRVRFDGIGDPKSTLSDALDKLSKLYDINFDINEKAFKFENVSDVAKTPIMAETPIPAMKNVRLSRVLDKILSRIPVSSGATYLVRSDHIEITTGTIQRAQIWGGGKGPFLSLIHAGFDKVPLEDALKELSEQSDFSIVLDNRAADKAKTPVSAKFLNTPLDTAVGLLADMGDLRPFHLDDVLYVTTKENAAALEARREKVNPTDDNAAEGINAGPPRKGTGTGSNIIPPGAGA
jgi:hypothetical protein